MKLVLHLCLLGLMVMVGCTVGREPITFITPDAGRLVYPDTGPPCDPTMTERLLTDFSNCGSCGVSCDISDANRCEEGVCRCGAGPVCSPGADCRNGMCVRADRFTECESVADCNMDATSSRRQDCLYDPFVHRSFCVEICEFDDECPTGFACVEGACTFLRCVREECDDIDNDCDGTVDENSDSTGPLSRWCFSGPDIDSIHPPCRRGVQVCDVGGRWSECEGEIPPRPEVGLLACNMRDDNCDGCVDGSLESGVCLVTEPNGIDILYLIDISGSMGGTIAAVISATSTFSSTYAGNPEFRFGLVLISGSGSRDSRAYVEVDFSDFSSFNAVLSRVTSNGGGSEPTWDAVYESSTDEIVHGVDTDSDGLTDAFDETMTGLSWREGSIRILIMFGDEQGQTYRVTRGLTSVQETEMCESLTHGESLTVFTEARFAGDYDECATVYTISPDPDTMVGHLSDIIADPCL